jgi:hypothetical protein
VGIQHNATLHALTAGRTDRTGARLRLPASATATVRRSAALVASLGHELLLVLEGQQFGLSEHAQSRTGDRLRRGHGRPERTTEAVVKATNLGVVADELRQVPVMVKRHIAMLRADRFAGCRQEWCKTHQTANELRDMAVGMSLVIVA